MISGWAGASVEELTLDWAGAAVVEVILLATVLVIFLRVVPMF